MQWTANASSFIWLRLAAKRSLSLRNRSRLSSFPGCKGTAYRIRTPVVIDLDKLSVDKAKLIEHCTDKPEDVVMTAAEAVMGR